MASLTQTAITTRKVVRYTIYLIIFLIIGKLVLGLAIGIVEKLFPAPPPVPTVAFGKLPALSFPTKNDLPKLTFTVQTPEGGLPTLATQAKVYFMPQPKPDLLALDNAKKTAQSLGFADNPVQITPTIYQFTNAQSPQNLQMNIVSENFSIGYNLNQDQSPLSSVPPSPSAAAEVAKNYLQTANLLPDDLTGPVTQEYLKVTNRQLVNAISLSESSLIKINFFRKNYDQLPSLTPSPNQANVWFIISGVSDRNRQIIGVQYYYFPVDETQYATYPLISAQDAFKNLQNGKAYIANLGQNTNGQITIRRVYLAYYDASVQEQFYQPIIAFEGDNGFVAYVPAVSSTYYSQ